MSDLSQFEPINASIQQAVDAISHAFVVYDADERFGSCHRKHREVRAHRTPAVAGAPDRGHSPSLVRRHRRCADSTLHLRRIRCPHARAARTVLERTGLAPHRLELEVTETSLMRDATAVLDALSELRLSAVPIKVDDFGSGYSSLGHLKRFPIDKLMLAEPVSTRDAVALVARPGIAAAAR